MLEDEDERMPLLLFFAIARKTSSGFNRKIDKADYEMAYKSVSQL